VPKTWWLSTLRSSWTHPAVGRPGRRAGQGSEPQFLRVTFGCNRCFRSRLGAFFPFGRDQKRRPRPETPSRAGAEGNPTTFRGDGHKEREYLWVAFRQPAAHPYSTSLNQRFSLSQARGNAGARRCRSRQGIAARDFARHPLAEREGFEPSDEISLVNSLAVSPIRPLSHLSLAASLALEPVLTRYGAAVMSDRRACSG
jgi:hypothetical protein